MTWQAVKKRLRKYLSELAPRMAAATKGFAHSFNFLNFFCLLIIGQLGQSALISHAGLWGLFSSARAGMIFLLAVALFIMAASILISWQMECRELRHKMQNGWNAKLHMNTQQHSVRAEQGILRRAFNLLMVFLAGGIKGLTMGYGTLMSLRVLTGVHPGLSIAPWMTAIAVMAGIVVASVSWGKEGQYFLQDKTRRESRFFKDRQRVHWWHSLLTYIYAMMAAGAKGLGYSWGVICLTAMIMHGGEPDMVQLAASPYFKLALCLLIPCIVTICLSMEGKGLIKTLGGTLSKTEKQAMLNHAAGNNSQRQLAQSLEAHKRQHRHIRMTLIKLTAIACWIAACWVLPIATAWSLGLSITLAVLAAVKWLPVSRWLSQGQHHPKPLAQWQKTVQRAWRQCMGIVIPSLTAVSKGSTAIVGVYHILNLVGVPTAGSLTIAILCGLTLMMVSGGKEANAFYRSVTKPPEDGGRRGDGSSGPGKTLQHEPIKVQSASASGMLRRTPSSSASSDNSGTTEPVSRVLGTAVGIEEQPSSHAF